MRKLTAFLLVLALIIAFSSCKEKNNEEDTSASVQESLSEQISSEMHSTEETLVTESLETEVPSTEAPSTETPSTEAPSTEAPSTEAPSSEAPSTEVLATESPVTDSSSDEDVSGWDERKIADFYKTAAEKTGSSVKSEQTVGLQDISVNNGQLGGVFSFVTPILSSFLSGNSTVTDGITGDFEKLSAEDISKAAAYSDGNGIVLEIILKEQEDKASDESREGSVSHGISTVGDLLGIMGQLKEKGLPIEINVEKTVLRYTEPVIRVLIDDSGKIVKGSWSSTVEISLSDYTFAGARVDSTRVVLDNKITVNGGF